MPPPSLRVSLVEHQDGAPVAGCAAPNKGHELPAAQRLLRSESVHLVGSVVTAQPLHCQTETAQIISQGKGGDSVLGLKNNQPTVRAQAEQKLVGATLPPFAPTASGHGRIQTRALSAVEVEPDALPLPGGRQVFDTHNTTTHKKDGGRTQHRGVFVSILTREQGGVERVVRLERGGWWEENPNHWRGDGLRGEDRCWLRRSNAVCGWAWLRTAL